MDFSKKILEVLWHLFLSDIWMEIEIMQAEEHNTCIEVAEGGWCSTHVDQEGQFQEGRYAVLFHHVLKGISHC